jgi:hypothetical protein
MAVLLLDAHDTRITSIKGVLGKCTCVVAEGAQAAIDQLAPQFDWDMVMLDYTIGTYSEREKRGTGMDVVDWYTEQKEEDRAKVRLFLIHSWDHDKSIEMFHKLRGAHVPVKEDYMCYIDAGSLGVTIQELVGLETFFRK